MHGLRMLSVDCAREVSGPHQSREEHVGMRSFIDQRWPKNEPDWIPNCADVKPQSQ